MYVQSNTDNITRAHQNNYGNKQPKRTLGKGKEKKETLLNRSWRRKKRRRRKKAVLMCSARNIGTVVPPTP